MVFRGLEVIFKIGSYILDSIKDNRLRNYKPAKLILEYSIVLSIFIIIIGFYVVFSSVGKTVSNSITMDADADAVIRSHYTFNTSDNHPNPRNESPINAIIMYLEYKEPISCAGDFKIKKFFILNNDGYDFDVIKEINLSINLHGFDGDTNSMYILPKNGVYTEIIADAENLNNSLFPIKILTFYFGDDHFLTSGPYTYNTLEFTYYLDYSLVGDVENKEYSIHGNATPQIPIICMDSVTDTNVSINKSLLRLTGVLIILGSISFVISLRQLLDKKQ